MLFIFVYRFDKVEIQEKIKKELNLNLTAEFDPYIDYDEDQKKLIIYLKKNKFEYIKLDTINPKKINKKENKRLFRSLTKIQKLGIIFLICCIKSDKIPLIQGETASGKSYLMKIFAQLFGQEIIIYQITSNSGMSIITGQDIIKTKIEKEEIYELKKNYKNIKDLFKEKKHFKDIPEDEYNLILKNIYLLFNDKTKLLKEDDKKKLKEAGEKIRNIIILPRRIEHKMSSFISATMKGGWVFFDGIEMGHSILFDTISSLCNENPQLNVLGSKEILILNKKNISPKFKFFLALNPSNLGKKTINQILFNSCARFSLTTLDSNIPDSTVVIYNSRFNNDINKKLWINICSKLASCHKINVEKSDKYINLMAGGIKFSPRHLIFLGNDGKKNVNIPEQSEDISNWVKTIFQLYYFNSYSQENDEKNMFSLEEIKNQVYDEFINQKNYQELGNLELNVLPEEVINILDELYKIQKSHEQDIFQFNFRSFVQKYMALKLNDKIILLIINNIEDTLNLLIYQNDKYSQKYDENLSNIFQISIMKNLLKELFDVMKTMELKDIENYSLGSNELLSRKELKPILLKMNLLYALLNDEELFTDKMNYKIYDERLNNLISLIKSFIENQNKKGFIQFILGCIKNSELIEIIDFFFPKHKFYENKNYDLIILYINTICQLIRNKNNFSIEIDKKYIIKYNPCDKIQQGRTNVNLCLNKIDSFILTAGTKISIPLKNDIENDLTIKRDYEDTETIIRFINEYSPKNNLTNLINDIYMFQEKNRKKEERNEFFTSQYFFDTEKNNNIFSRAWSILYGLTPKSNVYKFLLKYYFEKEKKFFNLTEEIYNSLYNLKEIEELINYFKKRFFYYNKNSFLWMNLINKIHLLLFYIIIYNLFFFF